MQVSAVSAWKESEYFRFASLSPLDLGCDKTDRSDFVSKILMIGRWSLLGEARRGERRSHAIFVERFSRIDRLFIVDHDEK